VFHIDKNQAVFNINKTAEGVIAAGITNEFLTRI